MMSLNRISRRACCRKWNELSYRHNVDLEKGKTCLEALGHVAVSLNFAATLAMMLLHILVQNRSPKDPPHS